MTMLSPQVCFTCKSRKKKCDKRLPQCSYCELKGMDCSYDSAAQPKSLDPELKLTQQSQFLDWNTCHNDILDKKPLLLHALGRDLLLGPAALDATLSSEVVRIIQACHQSIDDIGTRYFNGLHLWVPFFCPDQFQRNTHQFQSVPTAEYSLLLLSICLITYDPPDNDPRIGHQALYLHLKTLFTQIHVLKRPSLHLVQTGIFISIYEYAHGRPDTALGSLDICARMAYKLRLHQKPEIPEYREAWNTWWALRIFERVFYADSSLVNLPWITSSPEETDMLPHEVGGLETGEIPKCAGQVASVSLKEVGCFGRAAQAAYLLDKVTRATIQAKPGTEDMSALIVLDAELQRLLSATMNWCHGKRGGHCGAVGISIGALFILHKHILQMDVGSSGGQWRTHSQAALDTVAQMMLDISRTHRNMHGAEIDIISPVCVYVVRHTLQYLYEKRYEDSNAFFQDSDTLRQSLEKLNRRWPTESALPAER